MDFRHRETESIPPAEPARIDVNIAPGDGAAAQLRAAAVKLTRAEQRERRRLAKLLHDNLQQLLVAARLSTSLVRRRVADDETLRGLAQVDQLLDESIEVSRSLSVELCPPVLYDVGLVAALEWLVRHMERKCQLAVTFKAGADTEPPDLETRVILFDAVHEMLLNAAKHSGASQTRVDLRRRDDGRFEAAVADSGIGFDPNNLPPHSDTDGFGLLRIRERVEVFGGSVEIESAPGEGTHIRISVPFSPSPESANSQHALEGLAAPTTSKGVAPLECLAASCLRKIRVLLADDHEIVREGLASLLLDEPDMEVVAKAQDGQEAVDLALKVHPDVVLMDVSMPRLDGIEATRRIVARMPDIRIIGLSMHEKEDMAQAMCSAGAAAYLSKNGCSDTLISTIREEVR